MNEQELLEKLYEDNQRLRAANTRLKKMLKEHIIKERLQDYQDNQVINIVRHNVTPSPDCVVMTFSI